MFKMLSFLCGLFLALPLAAQVPTDAVSVDSAAIRCDSVEHEVVIDTDKGRIRVKLYNDTPLHRDNFLRLVRSHFYDGVLFHRIIPNFMVQAGDSASRYAGPGVKLGDSKEPYSVPAEIRFPQHYHKCGALAAARESDDVNPLRASSAYQFYITFGTVYDDENLAKAQAYLDEATQGQVKLTDEIKATYQSFGGMPYLDGLYTVFGEVVQGLDVVDLIQWEGRDENDRPFDDVHIVRAYQVK